MKEKLVSVKNGFLDLFHDINLEKILKLISLALGAVGIIYAIVYIFSTWMVPGKSKFYYGYFMVILISMIVAVAYTLKYLLTNKEFSFVKMYIVLSLAWGICFQFIMPAFSGPDETKHYFSAYHASNIIMGIKDHGIDQQYGQWIQDKSYFLIRSEDIYTAPSVDVTFPQQYEILADGCWFRCPPEGKEYVGCYEAPGRARRYLLSGIGITIARLLNWGFVGTLFAGRFMNVLFVTLMGALIVKLLPIGKSQFIMFMLFPELITLCGCYSYDNMSVLFSMLLLALCMYYSLPEKELHIWDMGIIAAVVLILIPNKQVYALFAIWFFAIPVIKWWNMVKGKKWYDLAGVAVLIAGLATVGRKLVMKYYWIVYANIFWKWDEAAVIEQDGATTSYTWDDVVADPIGTLKFLWEGVKVDFWYNLKHVVGSELGHVMLKVEVPVIITVILILLIVASVFVKRGKSLKAWQNVVIGVGLVLCLAAIFLGCLIRFTPLDGSERVQISYRYIIPLYMTLMVVLGTDQKENKAQLGLLYLENIVLVFAACHALTFLLHLRDGM